MTKRTVFIVGAGASKEVNLPTGAELKSKIAGLLDMRFDTFGSSLQSGSHEIVAALRQKVMLPDRRRGDINPYLHEAWHIRDALPQAISIDNFIDAHKENEKIALCGKLGIVKSILEAEGNSLLTIDDRRADSTIDFMRLDKTWYIPFFQQLTENCGKDDLLERFQCVTLIIFNYDRCIEHFIFHALRNYYKITSEEAADLVQAINIYHPYGQVGTLPWIDRNGAVGFGAEPHPEQLLDIASRIKTFTEGTNPDSSEIIQIRSHMNELDRLVFVGFAFHKLNMQLIAPEDTSPQARLDCFATAHGISLSDQEVIQGLLTNLYQRDVRIRMSTSTCGGFFNEYWRSLSF
ncbi:hypothetical protein [Spongiibacter marinus]|uniref:hypothetical protein n=1 Tax=Spongiibacter marinus TaxID=354246 RepID=UPI0035BE4CFD